MVCSRLNAVNNVMSLIYLRLQVLPLQYPLAAVSISHDNIYRSSLPPFVDDPDFNSISPLCVEVEALVKLYKSAFC